jgi:NAD+ synthase
MSEVKLDSNVLAIDCVHEVERIVSWLRETVIRDLRRRGVVVALSGGIDSSVCAALATRAFGREKVLALLLPERESSSSSTALGKQVATHLEIEFVLQDITAILEAIGCYRIRDGAICEVFPQYGAGWKSKVTLASGHGPFWFFQLVIQSPTGEIFETRLPHREYLQVLAAQNYKQRIRKTVEYFQADRCNYAVLGTPNRLEYDQGFFVKNGDGSADVKPIAHLYKSQVYALAKYLKLPEVVRQARPTTDTYSMSQGQDEFYFALPFEQMDLTLWAYNHRISPKVLGESLGFSEAQALAIYRDIESKRAATRYLHSKPLLVEAIQEICPFA